MQRKISPAGLIGLLLMAVLMLPVVRVEAGYLEDEIPLVNEERLRRLQEKWGETYGTLKHRDMRR